MFSTTEQGFKPLEQQFEKFANEKQLTKTSREDILKLMKDNRRMFEGKNFDWFAWKSKYWFGDKEVLDLTNKIIGAGGPLRGWEILVYPQEGETSAACIPEYKKNTCTDESDQHNSSGNPQWSRTYLFTRKSTTGIAFPLTFLTSSMQDHWWCTLDRQQM